MKCQILFSGKNKKVTILLSVELAQSVVRVNHMYVKYVFYRLLNLKTRNVSI